VLGVVTVNKLSRPFSDRFQCGPKKSVPVSTHLQNSGYWGRRQVAKNGRIEVFMCLVEICPPLPPGRGLKHRHCCTVQNSPCGSLLSRGGAVGREGIVYDIV
jgi:hypothetical protein